jgi:hypothetical protein
VLFNAVPVKLAEATVPFERRFEAPGLLPLVEGVVKYAGTGW